MLQVKNKKSFPLQRPTCEPEVAVGLNGDDSIVTHLGGPREDVRLQVKKKQNGRENYLRPIPITNNEHFQRFLGEITTAHTCSPRDNL